MFNLLIFVCDTCVFVNKNRRKKRQWDFSFILYTVWIVVIKSKIFLFTNMRCIRSGLMTLSS